MTTAADFGSDLDGIDDLDANMAEVDGFTLLTVDLACRFGTTRGGVIGAPDDGFDLTELLSGEWTKQREAQTRAQIAAQALRDERVRSVAVTIDVDEDGATRTLTITISGIAADGPFSLTLAVANATVQVLERP